MGLVFDMDWCFDRDSQELDVYQVSFIDLHYCRFVIYWPDFRVRLLFFCKEQQNGFLCNSLPSEGATLFQFFSKEKLGPIII